MRMLGILRKNAFLIALLLSFLAANGLLETWDPVGRFDVFSKNDYQKTLHDHPEPAWRKAFFGNSSVVAAYDARNSSAGYVNLGMNYGKITDLDAMLRKGLIDVEEELLIGLNLFTFMDDLPTDPSYPWHQKWYEPYLYFYRDKLSAAAEKYAVPLLKGEPLEINLKKLYAKELYYGTLDDEELGKKIAEYKSKYYVKTLDDFRNNLNALDDVIGYAKDNGIRVKVLWMPWNSGALPNPDYVDEIKAEVQAKLSAAGIDYTDWTDKFEREHFHDLGHLNFKHGRPLFTKELDQWAAES